MRQRTIAVVVLGDIGRSPRMLFHALVMAENGFEVDLIGYVETQPLSVVSDHPRIRVLSLGTPPRSLGGGGKLRLMFQVFRRLASEQLRLLNTLAFRCRKSVCVLIQNPPAIPLLPAIFFFRLLKRATIIIDCHNLGAGLLALRFPKKSILVRFYSFLEVRVLRSARHVLCVSAAMQKELADSYGVTRTSVLYDLPLRANREAFTGIAHVPPEVLLSGVTTDPPIPSELLPAHSDTRPLFTVVCPTSWTADDDFDLLLSATKQTGHAIKDRQTEGHDISKSLLLVITGQGPLKESTVEKIRSSDFGCAIVTTAWFSYEQYCQLLATADLGICIHRSSSGLDLPIKLADMKTAGLTACVLDYGPCLREQASSNDLFFSTSEQLSQTLTAAFFRDSSQAGDTSTPNRQDPPPVFWEDQWLNVMQPLLLNKAVSEED